jgi:hypothetical protein
MLSLVLGVLWGSPAVAQGSCAQCRHPPIPAGRSALELTVNTQELGWVIPFAASCPEKMEFDVVEVEGKKRSPLGQ